MSKIQITFSDGTTKIVPREELVFQQIEKDDGQGGSYFIDGDIFDCYLPEKVDGKYVKDEVRLTEINAKTVRAEKLKLINSFLEKHTVTVGSGNKYAADEKALIRMALKRDTIDDDAKEYWYEKWDAFPTNKLELSEAISKANNELQAFIDKTFSE